MVHIVSHKVSNSGFSSPLDMQVAKNVASKLSIRLITDIETGHLIPHYYLKNKFVEDKYGYAIKGFIKAELEIIFCSECGQAYPANVAVKHDGICVYSVSKLDIIKYKKNTGFLNMLTKNVYQNIMDFTDIVRSEAECDNEPYLVNAQNCIVDLASGKMLKHTPDILIRNVVNANYIELSDEKSSKSIDIKAWDKLFLFYKVISDAIWDKSKTDTENREIIKSFLSIIASLLIGNNKHKLVYIIIGVPNSGKSTLLEVLLGIFYEYATTFNNSALLVSPRTSNDIRPDIIALRGKRLLAGSEANKAEKFDNALLKQLSGNDKISVRKPHKGDMINFTMSGKLMLVTNYCPTFTDLDDQAFLNRMVIIDFNNAPPEFDTNLKEKLLTEDARDQIFSYLVTIGSEIVAKNNIYIHERFSANKQRILINQNSSVALFWKEHIRPYENYNIPANIMPRHPVSLLYSVMYLDFCRRLELKPLALEAFAKEFKELTDQFPIPTWKQGKSNNYYIGFDVNGGNENQYRNMLQWERFDKTNISSETVFE